MDNIFEKIEIQLVNKTWNSGLNSYQQANCQCSLTDDGFRIYRPPNLTVADNGNTMWGGLLLKPYDMNNKDVLVKGRTYIIKWHISGVSSNACTSIGWTNQMGCGGGGLSPLPSNVNYSINTADFSGEKDCFYKFTINDDIRKTCTTSYSGFTAGTEYLSYRDFMYGYGYTSTGTMGTDLYITNIRMYDITNLQSVNITKSGLCYGLVNEINENVRFSNDSEILSNEIYEL